jgi:chloramphenicol-sensitive protein RarD
VFVFGEPLGPANLLAFGCIWAALAIYSSEAVAYVRRAR